MAAAEAGEANQQQGGRGRVAVSEYLEQQACTTVGGHGCAVPADELRQA